jgi:NADH-quinone oxidoreductase subunit G
MVEIELDGQKVEVAEGCMVIQAAEMAGTYIPHFCYHKKLSIAANCRMCLVDVEKAPKPMPACATPVTNGMIVRTKSAKAIKAQNSVMEFLLINHPLDCPICDQGGECQLQDLAVGYGASASRYEEEKRVVFHKDVGPLISMEEMSRCIHCTRCVRFGQEVAGVMELGMIHRGEHSEITTVLGDTVDSELSGNMIDICPVGALTSKPFRYSARPWELSRRRSVSPHDSTGANLIVQVKNSQVMRVLPFENEAVNECWIADRDRFSYESLNSDERLTQPMLKQGGEWRSVGWQTALEYVANGLRSIQAEHGPQSIGTLASPHSTLEELYLAGQLMRGMGSGNIDYRLRTSDFSNVNGAQIRWLGTSIASLSQLDGVLVIGSNLRKDHPLFAQRIRQSVRKGGSVAALSSIQPDWAMAIETSIVAPADQWVAHLAGIAAVIADRKNLTAPVAGAATAHAESIASMLLRGERKAVLLGNGAAHHPNASALLALAGWIADSTGATVGYLTEAANTVGAQFAGALPDAGGLNAGEMMSGRLKAALLLGCEPLADCANGSKAAAALASADMVITFNAFKANMDISDVLLPIAPFTETPGTFVNASGWMQSFHPVVKPRGEARPAWKILRVLANLLDISGFDFESVDDVRAALTDGKVALDRVPAERLSNAVAGDTAIDWNRSGGEPVVAAIYQLDGMVRRAPSLQLTVDGRTGFDPAVVSSSATRVVAA